MRELSVELLLLYDNALSLYNSPKEACLTTTTIDGPHSSKTSTNDEPAPPQVRQPASLLQLQHFPRLAKLISARREYPEQLGQSLSESVIPAAAATAAGCVATRTTRPNSAGAASTSSWKQIACSASMSTLNRPGRSPSSKHRLDRVGCRTTCGERPVASGTLRPMSAPGRRRTAASGGGDDCERGFSGAAGRHQGRGAGNKEVAVGRTLHGETCRSTHELSRQELIGLVERLWERLGRVEGGHNRRYLEVC